MYCSKCGQTIPENAVYCPSCGALQSGAQLSNQDPVQEPQQAYTRPGQKRKKSGFMRIVFIALVVLIALWAFSKIFGGGDYEDYDSYPTGAGGVEGTELSIDGLREHYTTLRGNGEDKFTIMVYMIGSNLETDNGCASSDLSEMFSSEIGGNVNLIVQTGGAKEWHVEGIDPHSVQRWSVTEENIELVDDVGSASMTQSSTLSDFVSFCEKNYPADRYGMIFWDHGGGTVAGYGVDEYYPDKTLMLTDIDEALTDAGVKFDFVGYDACLMATIENAIMLEKHADYLIASEELEPGGGWRYDQWMPAVVENSSIETIELGKKIVDSFIEDSGSSNTLSVVELREIPYTYDKLCKFIDSAKLEIEQRSFREISSARSSARSYNDGQHDSVDIVDLVMRTECEGKEEVVAAVNSCVKYRNNCSVRGSSGLSMYFPYTVIDAYDHVRTDVLNTGVTPEYMSFFDQFVSILAGGQSRYVGATSVSQALGGEAATANDYSGTDWYNPEVVNSYTDYYDENSFTEREVVDRDGRWVLDMTDKEWSLITNIELMVLERWKDEGYIDLGSDAVWEKDDQGDLMIEYDKMWVAIEGQIVPFYAENESNNVVVEGEEDKDAVWFAYGWVPATLGEERIQLILNWSNENENGYVAGYRLESEAETGAVGRELRQLKEGDSLQFYGELYDNDGNFDSEMLFGDPIVITKDKIETIGKEKFDGEFSEAPPKTRSKLVVSYEDTGSMFGKDNLSLVSYKLTDIYRNPIFTEFVEFE